MKNGPGRHRLHLIRIVVSAVVFGLFVFLFMAPVAVAHRLAEVLPRTQFLPSFLATVGGGGVALGWVVVLGSTLLFGRVYCSSLCPLGAVQDGVGALAGRFRRERSYRFHPSHMRLRLVVLLGVAATAAAGSVVLIDLLGPYRIFGMIVHDFLTPAAALGSHVLFYLLKPIGVYIAPMTVPVDGMLLIVGTGTAVALFAAAARRGRLFCNTLCPVGALLSFSAFRSLFRIRIDRNGCVSCNACEHVCSAECIDGARMAVDAGRCIGCFSCLSACRFGAIHFSTGGARASGSNATDPSRRKFLGDLRRIAGGATAFFPFTFSVRRRALTPDQAPQTPIAPPGSKSVDRFTRLCISCHLCVSRCPTRVLQPSLLEYGIVGIMQPTLDYAVGFCEYECNTCSVVCPSAAILPLTLDEKQAVKIGRVVFAEERCVVVTNETECGACAEVCPTNAVRMTPYRDGLHIPETFDEYCTGCGGCEFACPVIPDKAIYVIGRAIHGGARVPDRGVDGQVETGGRGAGGDDSGSAFPF